MIKQNGNHIKGFLGVISVLALIIIYNLLLFFFFGTSEIIYNLLLNASKIIY